MACNVCFEKDTKMITCTCGEHVCEDCMGKYLDNINVIVCPTCSTPWSIEFMALSVSKSFLKDKLRPWNRKQFELLYVPNVDTIDYSRYEYTQRIKSEIDRKQLEMRRIAYEIEQLTKALTSVSTGVDDNQGPCPGDDCKGWLINNRCTKCKVCVCDECGAVKFTDHECKECLKIAHSASKAMKRCPWCKIAIEKSHGCNDMVCTRCGTRFNYQTMKITPKNSNNHYNDNNNVFIDDQIGEFNKAKAVVKPIDINKDIAELIENPYMSRNRWNSSINAILDKYTDEFLFNNIVISTYNSAIKIVGDELRNSKYSNEGRAVLDELEALRIKTIRVATALRLPPLPWNGIPKQKP